MGGPEHRSHCFHVCFWQRERNVLGRWAGTISREAPFLLAVYLCDHIASSTSSLFPVTATACFSFMKPGSPRGGHHRLQEGQVELVAEAEVIPTCVLTGKPEMRGVGHRTQPLGIRREARLSLSQTFSITSSSVSRARYSNYFSRSSSPSMFHRVQFWAVTLRCISAARSRLVASTAVRLLKRA
jgi:hypothetical protein